MDKEFCHEEDEVFRGANCLCSEAGRDGYRGEGCAEADGDRGADLLPLKRKYGGLGPSELRRLKQLEEENRKLKQMVADLSLDKHLLQEVQAKSSKTCQEVDTGIVSREKL